MFYILCVIIIGVSFAPLLIIKPDMWIAQGIWVQAGIGLAFSWLFFEKPKNKFIRNIPLGLLHLWLVIQLAFIFYFTVLKNKYDVSHFFAYFNFLCLLILYWIIILYLNKDNIEKLMKLMKLTVNITLLISALQILGLSQFFGVIATHERHNNLVSGLLSNGTHFSGFIASCVPLFFWQMKRQDIFSIILMLIVMMFTGTTIGDPSISGFIVLIVLFFYFYKKDYKKVVIGAIFLAVIGIFLFYHSPDKLFSIQGRMTFWPKYALILKRYFITGIGVGGYSILYPNITPLATHLHLEYYEFLLELGLIGMVLIINLIKNFFEDRVINQEQLVLKSMVLGFLVSCCFNFPAHLWLPATWCMVSYAMYFALKELNNGCIKSKRNT